MVYVDKAIWHWKETTWCHLLADSLEELHLFALELGVKKESFQSPPKVKYPHYDLPYFRRVLAIEKGALEISRREVIEKARNLKIEYERI
jgi:hypothetical protein